MSRHIEWYFRKFDEQKKVKSNINFDDLSLFYWCDTGRLIETRWFCCPLYFTFNLTWCQYTWMCTVQCLCMACIKLGKITDVENMHGQILPYRLWFVCHIERKKKQNKVTCIWMWECVSREAKKKLPKQAQWYRHKESEVTHTERTQKTYSIGNNSYNNGKYKMQAWLIDEICVFNIRHSEFLSFNSQFSCCVPMFTAVVFHVIRVEMTMMVMAMAMTIMREMEWTTKYQATSNKMCV